MQTKALLERGWVFGRGSAYAMGTVYVGGGSLINPNAARVGVSSDWTSRNRWTAPDSTSASIASTSASTQAYNANAAAVAQNTAVTNADTEEKKEEESIASKLAGLYDWVAVKLEYFGHKTQVIADQINDYISTALKNSLLKRQFSAIGDEINVNSRAARVYREQAENVATQTGMSSSLINKAKTGEWLFEDLSDEDTEKVSTFLQYWDKATEAEDKVRSLRNEQLKLFDDWMNMPIEKAKERVDRYAESMDKLKNAYSLVGGGQSALSAYLKTFSGRSKDELNSAQLAAQGNASNRPYTVLNPMLDAQLEEQKNTVKANKVAYEETKKNAETFRKEMEKAQKEAADQQAYLPKRVNWLLKQEPIQKNLSESQKNDLKKGKAVDTTGITDEWSLDVIKKYNKLVQLAGTANEDAEQAALNYNTALNKQGEAYSELADSETDYAQMLVDNEREKFNNVKDFYDSLLSYREALASNASSARSTKEAFGIDLNQSDYMNEINQLRAQRNLLDAEQLKLQKQLNESVASGVIKVGSQEYNEMATQILKLNDSMREMDRSMVSVGDDMRETLPFQTYNAVMEETNKHIEDINRSINELSNTSKTLDSGKSALEAYLKTAQKYSDANMTDTQTYLKANKGKDTFELENKLLDDALKEQKRTLKDYQEQYEVASDAVAKSRATLRGDKRSAKTANDAFTSQQNALLGDQSILKNLSKAQKKALESGSEISTNGITDSKTLDAVHAYNKALSTANRRNEAVKESTDQYNTALKNQKDNLKTLTEQEAKYAQTLVENEKKKFQNIQDFYDAQISYRQTIADQSSNTRSLRQAFRMDATKSDYTNEMAELDKVRNLQLKERNKLQLQLAKSVKEGKIAEGSEEYLAMDEEIRKLNSDIDSTTMSIISLQDEMRDNVILEKINKEIEKATKNVEKFQTKLSGITTILDATSSGASAFEAYSKVIAQYHGTTNLTKEQQAVRDAHHDRAFVGQNALLDLQLSAQKGVLSSTQKELQKINKLVSQANTEQKEANKNAKAADTAVKNRSKSLLAQSSITKNLSKTQLAALKNGEAVSTSGITNKTVLNAITKYNSLVTAAKTANEDAKHATEVYNDALDQQTTTMEDLKTAEADYAQMLVDNEKKKLDNISAYYSSIDQYRSTLAENLASARELKEAYGEDTVKSDYTKQITQLKHQRAAIEKEQELLRESFNTSMKKGIIEEGSQEFYEMKQQISDLDDTIDGITMSILDLQDEMRNEIFYRELNKALDTAEKLRTSMSSITGLIRDEMMFDDNGDITAIGITNLAMNVKEYESALGSLSTLLSKRDKMIKSYNNGKNTTNYNQKEFEADMAEITNQIQTMLSTTNTLRTAITDMLAKTSKAELDATLKVIDARSELLKKQKEYYDYDKTLRGKTNDLQALDAQLRALEGIDDLETKAMRQRLEAQRADLQEDLDETVKDHAYELQIAGLDDLKVELQENYDNYVRDLNGNLKIITDAVKDATKTTTQSLSTVNSTVQTLLSSFSKSLTGNIIGVPKYASGSKYVSKNGYGLTNENGGEIVVTDKGVFMPLPKGSGVVPSYLTSNLFGLAENYSQIMKGTNGGSQLIAPVVTSNVTINGSNLSEQDLIRAMNSQVREMSKQIQNDIRKDLNKSR